MLVEKSIFEEFWHRDVEESIRQGNPKPFVEEAVLQVSVWGFSPADLQVQRKCLRIGILSWLWSWYSHAECELTGFLGPIHIWQVYLLLLCCCFFSYSNICHYVCARAHNNRLMLLQFLFILKWYSGNSLKGHQTYIPLPKCFYWLLFAIIH